MKTWCVAKPSSDQATLLDNINYACSHVDCRVLSSGCPCYSPGNLINHASIAMNLYYQANGRNYWNCNFKNSGLIVITNPSKFALTLLLFLSKTILYCLKDIRLRFQFFFLFVGYGNCYYQYTWGSNLLQENRGACFMFMSV